jgi:hypothetical protein
LQFCDTKIIRMTENPSSFRSECAVPLGGNLGHD